MAEVGEAAPDFTMATDGGGEVSLADLRGQNVVLYFYPKDDTPGCTTESCDFRDDIAKFGAANATVIGVSRDDVASHDKFKAKFDLPFALASDEDGTVTEAYGVWVEKNMYGRKYMGIERATFLIDKDGNIAQAWRKVKVPGHVDAVLQAVEAV